MFLFSCIDGLMVGARYLAWAIVLLCIPCSVVLIFANIGLGPLSALTFLAALLFSVGATLLLLPERFVKGPLEQINRFVAGGVLVLVAAVVMGLIYLAAGGFPAVNLLFV